MIMIINTWRLKKEKKKEERRRRGGGGKKRKGGGVGPTGDCNLSLPPL